MRSRILPDPRTRCHDRSDGGHLDEALFPCCVHGGNDLCGLSALNTTPLNHLAVELPRVDVSERVE